MKALALLVPRPKSVTAAAEREEEDEFHALVESIETLLFTSSDHPDRLDRTLLAESIAALAARWPDAAATYQPRLDARGRHRADRRTAE